ncbi:MAG: NAD(P)-binding protein [Halocynthiibacter sp.]
MAGPRKTRRRIRKMLPRIQTTKMPEHFALGHGQIDPGNLGAKAVPPGQSGLELRAASSTVVDRKRPGRSGGRIGHREITQHDTISVIGAGPAGLVCAISLARAGRLVVLHEQHKEVGHRFHGDFPFIRAPRNIDRDCVRHQGNQP